MPVVKLKDYEMFQALIETLKKEGWAIIEYKDHLGGLTMTIVPIQDKKQGVE